MPHDIIDNRTRDLQRAFQGGLDRGLVPAGDEATDILYKSDLDDELSLYEGLNLQDANHVINYDLHWNPIRLEEACRAASNRDDEGMLIPRIVCSEALL